MIKIYNFISFIKQWIVHLALNMVPKYDILEKQKCLYVGLIQYTKWMRKFEIRFENTSYL